MAKASVRIPFQRPRPPRLSSLQEALQQLDDTERFTNFGPRERDFCRRIVVDYFHGGAAATVCNATLGLMLAVRQALHRAGWNEAERRERQYAVLPAFSFAALAQAVVWNGLTPWFIDIDAETWLPSRQSESEILKSHHKIGVMLPAATFGNSLDIGYYADLSSRFGIPVVIDAAPSIGCLDKKGNPFGAGSPFAIVFSMHATKVFATAEAGLVYSTDEQLIEDIRRMSNFGFGDQRQALLPGLNAKLSEVGALLCLSKLDEIEHIAEHRSRLAAEYARLLPEYVHQKQTGQRIAYQFYPVVLPDESIDRRRLLDLLLDEYKVEAAHYFSPHLAEQPFFAGISSSASLEVTDDIGRRIVSLPLHDTFTPEDVAYVATAFRSACARSAGTKRTA